MHAIVRAPQALNLRLNREELTDTIFRINKTQLGTPTNAYSACTQYLSVNGTRTILRNGSRIVLDRFGCSVNTILVGAFQRQERYEGHNIVLQPLPLSVASLTSSLS